jgi:hypothetical protein
MSARHTNTDKRTADPDAATQPPDDDAILLQDLAPRRDVKGGSGKLLFGEQPVDDAGPSQEP